MNEKITTIHSGQYEDELGDASIAYSTPVGVYGTVPGQWSHVFRVGTVFMALVVLITIVL